MFAGSLEDVPGGRFLSRLCDPAFFDAFGTFLPGGMDVLPLRLSRTFRHPELENEIPLDE